MRHRLLPHVPRNRKEHDQDSKNNPDIEAHREGTCRGASVRKPLSGTAASPSAFACMPARVIYRQKAAEAKQCRDPISTGTVSAQSELAVEVARRDRE